MATAIAVAGGVPAPGVRGFSAARFGYNCAMRDAGSDRGFGLLFAALFALAGAVVWVGRDEQNGRFVATLFAASGLLLLVALLAPGVLAPLNRAWFRLGLLMSRVVNPLVLTVLFYAVVTPTGLLLRLLGKDPLRLRRDPRAATYWIDRRPPGPQPASMKNQF